MKKKTQKTRSGISKHFDKRSEAFNQAKRDRNIAKSEQPHRVVKPGSPEGIERGLDKRNKRLYIFQAIVNLFNRLVRGETHIREDHEAFYSADGNGDQPDHFNVGNPPGKLKDHYYYKKPKK